MIFLQASINYCEKSLLNCLKLYTRYIYRQDFKLREREIVYRILSNCNRAQKRSRSRDGLKCIKIFYAYICLSLPLSLFHLSLHIFIFTHYRRKRKAASTVHRGNNRDNPSIVMEHHNRVPAGRIKLVIK